MNIKNNECACQSSPWGGYCSHDAEGTTTPQLTQPAELAEKQGVDARALIERYDLAQGKFHLSLSDDGFNDTTRIRLRSEMDTIRKELIAALAETGKQQVVTGPTAPNPLTLHGLIEHCRVAANPSQGAVPSYMHSLIGQALPHLKRLDELESGDKP